MQFDITPDDIVDRDEDGNVIQLNHKQGWFAADTAGPMLQSPVELAERYVRTVGELYGISNREMLTLSESFTGEPKNEKSKLRRDQEKSMMETTVVNYQQTYRGLPVWNSTLSVVVSGDPPQIIGSSSTLKKDVEVEAPPRVPELRGFAAVDMPETLEEVLGVDNSAGEGFVVNSTRMLVYGYDPDERIDPASQIDETDEASAWGAQQSVPTLPLPPVDDGIKAGEFYVVREVLFTLTVPDWGELNWRAFVEVETDSVLYLRAFVASANCCVYLTDPVSSSGNLLSGASPVASLNAARNCGVNMLGLNPPSAGVQSLNGAFVRVVDTDLPTISPPTETNPFEFEYPANTDDFAAVNGYFHMDAIYRMVENMGFDLTSYFDGTTFPVPVDHRGENGGVNAHAIGNASGTGMGRFTFGLVQSGQPVGIAATVRVCLHEFGHALLHDHVGSPNFGWAHSAGDTMAAVLHDPGSNAPDRFETFPFMKASNPGLQRRHDRNVADGWAWGGSRDNRQYGSEQILSTLMFRIYRVTGGDDDDINVQRFAGRYLVFLIIKAIGLLTATTPNPVIYVNALMNADRSNVSFEGHPGGAWHKLFRWSFEKQGLYQPSGAPTPVTSPGAPPPVDVYIDDGRNGEYAPYLPDFGNTPDIWNRLADDGGITHQPPAANTTNYLYVRVRNRGTQTANNVVAKAFQGMPGTALEWPTHWQPLTTAQLAAGSIGSGANTIVGPFEWTPAQMGGVNVLVSVSAPGDESNADTVNGAISNARLVPLDNNIAQRDMIAVNTPPVLEDIAAIVVDENSQVDRNVVATDAQGQPLVFTLNGPSFTTLTATSDSTADLVAQPGFEDSGNYLALVRATDPLGAFDEKTVPITVNNVNRPPVLANIGPLFVHEGSELIRTITASDPDLQVVTFTAAGLPAFATFNDEGGGTGTLTLKPDYKDAGLYHVTVTVTDPEGATDSESFSIRVINALMPLTTQINELPFQHDEGIIELKVNSLLPNLASQVQIQSGANWVNITNANGDRAWFHENLVANEVVRYAYDTNTLGGLYRWVIYDKAEGLDQGWAVSDPFSISEMGKHIIVTVTLP